MATGWLILGLYILCGGAVAVTGIVGAVLHFRGRNRREAYRVREMPATSEPLDPNELHR